MTSKLMIILQLILKELQIRANIKKEIKRRGVTALLWCVRVTEVSSMIESVLLKDT